MEACRNSANMHVAISDVLLNDDNIPQETRDLLQQQREHWLGEVCSSFSLLMALPRFNSAAQSLPVSYARACVLDLYTSLGADYLDVVDALEQAFALRPLD